MEIEKSQIKEIVETLPIGFYAHTRVETKMDDTAETSYFVPNTREIFISSQLIQDTLKKVDKCDSETVDRLVRGQVYHELSHAILTPKSLDCGSITNIFEDERIERLLDNYFYNVDFKWQIKTVCDFDNLQPPRNAKEKFFQVVRFRVGEEKYVKKVGEIIERYKNLNWNTPYAPLVCNYTREIYDLYYNIENDFEENPTPAEEFEKQKEIAKQQMSENMENAEIPEEYQNAPIENENGKDNENGDNGKEKSQENEKEDCESCEESEEHGKGAGNAFADSLFNNAFDSRVDSVFYQQVENILNSFSKKNSGGGAVNSYSGVFNPRSAGREDYRYFDRKTAVRSSNRYGSFHLNLFIDNSGSFSNNARLANQIICTLCELERKYPFFSVDFALCGDEVVYCEDKAKAFVKANQGTEIQMGADLIVKQMQKANTLNCNIVLYDGWADSAYSNTYQPFDIKNTTLILDKSCERYCQKVRNAKIIICQNYLSQLKEQILKTLQNALR